MGVGVAAVRSLVLDEALSDPRGDEVRRHAHAETRKVEGDVLAVERGLGVGKVVAGRDVLGGRDVVREAAVLVKGEDEERLVPLRGGAEGLVDLLHEGLAVGSWAGRVERLHVAALGVDVGELGECARLGVCEELGEGLDVGLGSAAGDCPVVEEGVGIERGVEVVDPQIGRASCRERVSPYV